MPDIGRLVSLCTLLAVSPGGIRANAVALADLAAVVDGFDAALSVSERPRLLQAAHAVVAAARQDDQPDYDIALHDLRVQMRAHWAAVVSSPRAPP